jgi:hypothetical protein
MDGRLRCMFNDPFIDATGDSGVHSDGHGTGVAAD